MWYKRKLDLQIYEAILSKILASESQQYVQKLITSTFTRGCQGTLYKFSTCRDHVKISVGIVIELHRVGIHVVYNQMNVMCNGIVARRHTHECR